MICQLPKVSVRWDMVIIGLALLFTVMFACYVDGVLDGRETIKQITRNEKMIILKREANLTHKGEYYENFSR